MSKLFIEDTTLTTIGNAIRGKEGSTEPIPTVDMAERIANLPSGVSIPLGGFAFNPIEGLEINGYEVTE